MRSLPPRGTAAAWFAVVAALAASGSLRAQSTLAPDQAAPVLEETAESVAVASDGRVTVFVQLEGASGSAVFKAQRDRTLAAMRYLGRNVVNAQATAERAAARDAIAAARSLQAVQRPVVDALSKKYGAAIIATHRYALNGVTVLVSPDKLGAIRTIPGVKRVSLVAEQAPTAASSLNFTGARTFWGTVAPDLGLRGADIGVGVIDTGVDHMHTGFGGPGGTNYAAGATTVSAYPADPVATPPTTSSFPTPKVVWGFDFAGDAYDAGGTTNAALLPVPDLNPMDTNGHGSGVGTLMAGLGVNNDGTTYTGSYDRLSPDVDLSLRATPGYAPEAKIYAFRVFGTSGTTNLSSVALDAAAAIYIWQSNPSVAWDGAVSATMTNAAGSSVVVNYTLPQPPTSPRLRVVNLSLGSASGDFEESTAFAAQNAADAGLIVVLSAGNNYDTYYITGAPGVASGGISVAASMNDKFPAATANAPVNGGQAALVNLVNENLQTSSFSPPLASTVATSAIYANPNLANFTATAPSGVTVADTGLLVTLKDPAGLPINLFANNGSGGLAVSMNPAANNVYAGKIVLVDRGSVSFHQKALAVERAGGIAAIIVNSTGTLGGMSATAGYPTLVTPALMIDQATGGQYTNGGALNTGVSRTVSARPDLMLTLGGTGRLADTMATYSSRGPRRTDSGIKPDISAPAENVAVASATSGNLVRSFNGTSSAAPHTAGAMALLKQLRPTWSNYELKSLLLNSAANDIFTDVLLSGPRWGVTRQGVGRWSLDRFSGGGNSVILFAQDPADSHGGVSRAGTVSLSFGVKDIVGLETADRTVIARNKSNVDQSFTIGFSALTTTPGVSFSFPGGNSITVPANSEVSFTVRMTADASLMRHATDASTRLFQFVTNTNASSRIARPYLNEASGFITLTPVGGLSTTHRLTVQAFPRRASTLAPANASLVLNSLQTLSFSGSGYNTGPNTQFINSTFTTTNNPADIISFAKGFELQYSKAADPLLVSTDRAGDIKYVGITSDAVRKANPFDVTGTATTNQSAVIVFGIATHGQYDTPDFTGTEYFIEVDRDRNGTTDIGLRQFPFTNGEATTSRTNISLPVLVSPPSFSSGSSTGFFLNVLSSVYTNHYNNDVLMIPVRASGTGSLGLTLATSKFNYRVNTLNRGVLIQTTPWLTYDLTRPGIAFPTLAEPALLIPTNTDGSTNGISMGVSASNLASNGSLGLLVLTPMNAQGNRAHAVLSSLTARLVVDSFSPTSGPAGGTFTLSGSGFTGTTAVTVGGTSAAFTTLSDTQILVTIPSGTAGGSVRVLTPAGAATSKTRFVVTP